MKENSNAHGRTKKWTAYPQLSTRVALLHYEHAEYDANRNKKDGDIRSEHWSTVNRSFQAYLGKYPNDTFYRSKFAIYAIKCGKTDEAARQLQVLDKYAVPWVFGGEKKLREYQGKYLKK